MTLDEIKELIQVVKDSGVAELELQRGENRVWIKRALAAVNQEIVLPPAAPAADAYAAPPAAPASGAAAPEGSAAPQDASLATVKSPIVGTFYEAPKPGADSFVKVGDTVQPGQVLCIIESMKLMNEIESELAGVVVQRFIENAQPVEYGQALFAIRPL